MKCGVLSFIVMNILIFIALDFILCSEISTGPHSYFLFGWIDLDRKFNHGHFQWSVQGFDLSGLMSVVLISSLLTLALSKALKSLI